MLRGIYSAASGMEIAARSNEVTAENLAHAIVPGFRQRGVANESFQQALDDATADYLGARVGRGFVDFRPGAMQQTGAPLDLALRGDGFFTLQSANGPVYSRDGVFQRSADGRLVNSGGLAVLGERGPITIPAQAANIVVGPDGTITANGNAVDRLQMARFTDPSRLEPVGTTLFRAPPEAGLTAATSGVVQGFREGSNVQIATTMATIVREMRYFEASQRALRALSDSLQLVTRPT